MTAQELEAIRNSLPNDLGGDIVSYALTRLGDPYSMDKRGQGSYVDCSYLVRWSYQQAGVTSYKAATAAEQARHCVSNDMIISRDQLRPGDAIFWRKNGCDCGRYKEIHHVAIYIGNGLIIEASSSQGCVRIKEIWGEGCGGKWQVLYYSRPY
jgi:cell wall-associated NlpC family hydrolase